MLHLRAPGIIGRSFYFALSQAIYRRRMIAWAGWLGMVGDGWIHFARTFGLKASRRRGAFENRSLGYDGYVSFVSLAPPPLRWLPLLERVGVGASGFGQGVIFK